MFGSNFLLQAKWCVINLLWRCSLFWNKSNQFLAFCIHASFFSFSKLRLCPLLMWLSRCVKWPEHRLMEAVMASSFPFNTLLAIRWLWSQTLKKKIKENGWILGLNSPVSSTGVSESSSIFNFYNHVSVAPWTVCVTHHFWHFSLNKNWNCYINSNYLNVN